MKLYEIIVSGPVNTLTVTLVYVGKDSTPSSEEFTELLARECKQFLILEEPIIVANLFTKNLEVDLSNPYLIKCLELVNLPEPETEKSLRKHAHMKKLALANLFNDTIRTHFGAASISPFVSDLFYERFDTKADCLIWHTIHRLVNEDFLNWRLLERRPAVKVYFPSCMRDRVDPTNQKDWIISGEGNK